MHNAHFPLQALDCFTPVRDGDGLRSGDEAVRVISWVATKRSVWSRVCVDSEAIASLPAETDDGDADGSASPPAKHTKTDSRSASLKFLATTAVTPVPAADCDFDGFIAAPAPSGVDALVWWWEHATAFQETASIELAVSWNAVACSHHQTSVSTSIASSFCLSRPCRHSSSGSFLQPVGWSASCIRGWIPTASTWSYFYTRTCERWDALQTRLIAVLMQAYWFLTLSSELRYVNDYADSYLRTARTIIELLNKDDIGSEHVMFACTNDGAWN